MVYLSRSSTPHSIKKKYEPRVVSVRNKTIIHDAIYGSVVITEPVLSSLLQCDAMKRLRKIGQGGVPSELYINETCSRFDHSVGVMLLLRKMGASVEEQVSGLLHDVSHTAFSHTIDYVMGTAGREDFQDNRHEEVVCKGELAEILGDHGFEPSRIANCELFSLLEQDAPRLCADRVDYTLHELGIGFNSDVKRLHTMVDSIMVYDGRMMFSTQESAANFAYGYYRCQEEHWGGFEGQVRTVLFSSALREAYTSGELTMEDFLQDDEHCMDILNKSGNENIQKLLSTLRLREEMRCELQDADSAPYVISKKWRYIDPEFVDNERVMILSEVDSEYKEMLEVQRVKPTRQGFRVCAWK